MLFFLFWEQLSLHQFPHFACSDCAVLTCLTIFKSEVQPKYYMALRLALSLLIVCVPGCSGSVVTAYLMYKERLSAADALASLRQASPSACPNDGFLEQVRYFDQHHSFLSFVRSYIRDSG
jgi:protein-tyrosine phosphatase